MKLHRTSRTALQIIPALFIFLLAQYLGAIKKVEPFYTYLYLFSWAPFLWVIDRILLFRKNQCYFSGVWEAGKLRRLGWLFAASTTFWLIFEVFNFRINNWIYVGLPQAAWIRWPGYALSYATVLPGVFFLAELIDTFVPKKNPGPDLLYVEIIGRRWSLWVGLGMLTLPLLWPRFFFPLVWGSLFFLLEPVVQVWGGHSLLQDWKNKRWVKTASLLLAGLICGLFWESCNMGAGAKWRYTIPYVDFFKIGEMPILGFLGFPPFALELFIMHQFAQKLWQRLQPGQKIALKMAALIFWAMAFWGIDQLTWVRDLR
jgi:hypothetical protein